MTCALETAANIAEIQGAIKARAGQVPKGEFISAMGGWNTAQFAERRMPTLAELDAATADHPVILYQSALYRSRRHQLRRTSLLYIEGSRRQRHRSHCRQRSFHCRAHRALRNLQVPSTFEDKLRGTADAMAYAASVGITTSVDMGAFNIPGTPDLQDAFTFDGLASANPFSMYDAFMALDREGKMTSRLRIFFLSMDTRPDVPLLSERVRNTLRDLGDDMLRLSGIGEFATQWPLFGQVTAPANYTTALKLVAEHGWPFQQHSLSLAEDKLTASTFEEVNKITPIANLRWSVAHVPRIDQETVNRFKALGAGIAVHPFEYLAGGAAGNQAAGPPLRMILDSGIHVGAGSDAAQISTLDPWPMIYYMVTGKNSSGVLINDKQQLTRQEALRLYTAENGWFFREEEKLGSLEPGKLGDVVVLSDDYFDPKKVSDEAIKHLKSVLTVVGGTVVYDQLK